MNVTTSSGRTQPHGDRGSRGFLTRVGRAWGFFAAAVTVTLLGTSVPALATPQAPAGTAPHAARTTSAAATREGQAFDGAPSHDALVRLIGGDRAGQVSLRTLDRGDGPDRFEVVAQGGKLVVSGTSPAVQLTGFGWYLRHVAHADVAITGSQLNLPAVLPLPDQPIRHTSSVDHRFALNDTDQGYAGAYLSWPEWQHRIDVLALHGINEVLVYEGQEAVYEQTLQRYGYSAQDARAWIPQPAHQSWWLLENMCCSGSPISQQLIDRRVQLAQKMTGRLRSLGMTPVLPGYFGTVPTDFEQRNPGADTVPQGNWDGLQRPDWLAPTDPLFAKLAATFYQVQSRLFGDTTMYKMDLVHEGGTAGDIDIKLAAKAVQHALNVAHPEALWAILGWEKNPLPEVLQAIDTSKVFIVDGMTDEPAVTDRDKDFAGTSWAFGTIWNFGGHTNIGARLSVWNQKFYEMRDRPGSAVNGIALMPEAIDNNPAAVAFFTDMPWEQGPVDFDSWFDDYATARYGGVDPHAQQAWRTLAHTAYSWPADKDSRHVTALFDDQPSLSDTGTALPYDSTTFDHALGELLQVAPDLRNSEAYRYDLVDVARQVLANHSRLLLPRIRAAYTARDQATFNKLSGQWLDQMRLMDRLLGTQSSFLLGAWQKQATHQAGNATEAAALDYDLKSLVTFWQTGASLQDYARREFNGLVGDYYLKRWQLYFDTLATSLRTGEQPAPIDWMAYAEKWARAGTAYPATPKGDSHQEASKVADQAAGDLHISIDHKGLKPGDAATVTETFTNTNVLRATGKLALSLDAPQGFDVSAATPVSTESVPAGGEFTATWTLSAHEDAEPGAISTLSAHASWASGTGTGDATDATRVLVGQGTVPDGYLTWDNTHATFAHRGDDISIAGGGEDLGTGTSQYATAYLQKALSDDSAMATEVTFQDGSSEYTRAGLIAGNDLSAQGTGGFADIAVTPGHGCVFSWDSDGNGTLDSSTEAGGFAPRVYVRLAKSGDRVTGSCSSDRTNWTIVGTGTVPGAAATEDVGLFNTAMNRLTGQESIATFTGGITAAPTTSRDASKDTLQSLNKPVTALASEGGHPPTAANDGSRANSPYWGGPLTLGGTWWQVDLGAVDDVSKINVRNYVDGSRSYTYRVEGSVDGKTWFTLGGKSGTSPATDTGDTTNTEARARYIRVVGLTNTANSTFHLTEVSVYGTPVNP